MEAGSSSYNPGNPYLSHVCGPNIVTMKLTGRDTYDLWKTQMLCLLESHDMLGFIQLRALGKEKVGEYNHQLWRRSDALVKGWILGTLSKQTLKDVVRSIPNTVFTAKDVWDRLQSIYGPPNADHDRDPEERIRRVESTNEQETEEDKKVRKEAEEKERSAVEEKRKAEEKERSAVEEKRKAKERQAQALYAATLEQDYWEVVHVLERKVVTLRDKITINGNTALHVAVVTSTNKYFLEEMLDLATQDNPQQLLDIRNSEGSTLLHVAAIVGNKAAAELLVGKHPDMVFAKDNEGQTPVARALSNMHTDTYLLLWRSYVRFSDSEKGDLFDDSGASELLVNMISSKDYRSAWSFLRRTIKGLPNNVDTVLMAIAQNFPPDVNFWEDKMLHYFKLITRIFKFVEATERKEGTHRYAIQLLHDILELIMDETELRLHHDYYNNAILEATRRNVDQVVEKIVSFFPNAIWCSNGDGHNIIQYAVINRSEKVYNLLYRMSEHKNIYRTIVDPFRNNLLHLAARLAPAHKLNHVSGAALQIQLELQWFKEVERFVCPLNVIQKNSFGETPQMLFTKEHKELVIEGEKWMKETAQSYTITAALITTIVFAAAITVPGGNKQDNGIPVFTNKMAFTIFAVSDAISLFTSVTSLLMFLSILTARFSEQDFLIKLPTKLIIGLASLFISTTAMLVAFGATLFLVFGQNNSWMLAPIAAFTCLPITSFLTLQFPLIYDLISATYGRSMFGKKSDDPFY